MARKFTLGEVSRHNSATDLLLIINGKVYDVTKFQHEHPGGDEFLLDQGGQDVTELFEDADHSKEARQLLGTLLVGDVEDQARRQPVLISGEQDKGSDLFHYYLYLVLFSLSLLLLACFAVPFDTLHKGLSKHS